MNEPNDEYQDLQRQLDEAGREWQPQHPGWETLMDRLPPQEPEHSNPGLPEEKHAMSKSIRTSRGFWTILATAACMLLMAGGVAWYLLPPNSNSEETAQGDRLALLIDKNITGLEEDLEIYEQLKFQLEEAQKSILQMQNDLAKMENDLKKESALKVQTITVLETALREKQFEVASLSHDVGKQEIENANLLAANQSVAKLAQILREEVDGSKDQPGLRKVLVELQNERDSLYTVALNLTDAVNQERGKNWRIRQLNKSLLGSVAQLKKVLNHVGVNPSKPLPPRVAGQGSGIITKQNQALQDLLAKQNQVFGATLKGTTSLKRMKHLTNELSESSAQFVPGSGRLEKQNQALQDQVTKLEIKTVFGPIAVDPNKPLPPAVPARVRGLVRKVDQSGKAVELTIGSDDGLFVGHTVEVFNKKQYLGRVEIVKVTPDKAVGKVIIHRGKIRSGDYVSTNLSKAAEQQKQIDIDALKNRLTPEELALQKTSAVDAAKKERQRLLEMARMDIEREKQMMVTFRALMADRRFRDAEDLILKELNKPVEGRGPGEGGDKYSRIVENPFHAVFGKRAVSTFSIDVDTASYANVRQFLLQSHQMPPPDAVRIEELVNYFDYDYKEPTGKMPFAARVEVAGCPWQPGHRLVRIALKGKEIKNKKRPVSNLVFLLDVSGSMDEPSKLPLLKQGMKLLAQQLGSSDRVAIVVYAGSEGLALSSTLGDQKEKIIGVLDRLHAGGSTAGGAGIRLAYKIAKEHFVKGGVNRVILCTDGDFNVGTTSTAELERLVEKKAKDGTFLTVLGFGRGNLNDAMMENISNKGNGNYHYIDSLTEARKVLVEEIGGTLVTIAKDVKIQIEFNPARVAAYRLIGYENRMLAARDFNDDKKDAGEIGAGHKVTALYEIVPTGKKEAAKKVDTGKVDDLKYQTKNNWTKASDSQEILTIKLRYKKPDGDKSTKIEFPVVDSGKSFARASKDYKFASAVASFGMLLRNSNYKGNATYASVLEIAAEGKGPDKHGYREEFLQIVKQAKQLAGK